ncbi:UNKNOWN [Stylonychia lemnae]|uniref:Vacuolar atp synthase subunit e n=1 Tax=Stylonychia lemnae TaxID=5949 RepID=A0A078ARG3_STYLE|nr:UNKNOWN [Stylonychia lemnae]|eukprot:CDW84804.1 UNKNOWN [Stylonychia lemnae]
MTSLETDAFELKRMMRQEAHEKAYEIQVMGQRMFEKEKEKIVQEGVESLNTEFDKKLMNLTMNLNIERSTKINQTRILRMTERNKCIEKVKEETKEQLLKTIVNPTNYMYKNAIKNLIIQGMIKLLEPELFLKCRKEDQDLVKSLLPECEQEFKDIMAKEASESDLTYSTQLKLVETEYLTNEEGGECGGIILFTPNRKIVCLNTLKSRLELCFEELLPHIRKLLFPKKKEGTR